jgi:protease II
VWVLPFDPQSKPLRLVGPGAAEDHTGFGMLSLSPDETRLAYARTGDDGYSRMSVVKSMGGESYAVSTRRDCYPLGWAADSSAVFYIEGNAWQGESTALMKMNASGSGRTVLVSGAGR